MRRLPLGPLACLLASTLAASALVACAAPSETATPTPTPAATPAASPIASPTAASSSSATPIPSAAAGITETDWGPIWDTLPPGFPRYPGSEPTETGAGPASAIFDVPADVQTVTTWLQASLEHAGYSTLSLSGPLEDGSMEIDSQGPADACLVRTTVAPLGGSTIVTVLYGASCPQS